MLFPVENQKLCAYSYAMLHFKGLITDVSKKKINTVMWWIRLEGLLKKILNHGKLK